MENDPILKINLKSASYPNRKKVLEDINIEVKKGEFIVLTGPSGSGKTTLMRVLNGLLTEFFDGHWCGKINVCGKDFNSYKNGSLASVMGNVFQSPKDQFFSLIAKDEVALVGENLGMDLGKLRKRVDEVFEILDIKHLKDKSIFEMSGGQMQKVAIGAGICYRPPILLLDEPSASLDFESTKNLGQILSKLKKLKVTVIVSEHRLFYLKDLLDTMYIFKDGRVENSIKKENLNDDFTKKNNLRCLEQSKLKAEKPYIKDEKEINVKDLTVKRKSKTLAENVSFSLVKGECMAIVGKNGVGKSTLAMQLAGLLELKDGYTNIGSDKKQRLNSSYYVLQDADNQIFFDTVENELIENRRLNEAQKEKISYLLKEIDLWEKRLCHPQELSGGEKQRLVLATAFNQNKRLLILDEPSSGLDYGRMEKMAKLIDLCTQKMPAILITHDLELLFKTCQTALLLDKKGGVKIQVAGNEKRIVEFLS